MSVREAWAGLREMLEDIDLGIALESDHALLNLYYAEPLRGNTILWLIGEYISLVDTIVIIQNQTLRNIHLVSHLRNRWLECRHIAMPDIGFITGLFPTGVG